MTKNPATCAPRTSLRLVAQLMTDHDCHAVPIVDSGHVVGIVTDRDITCRAVARGADAASLPASAVMSPCVIAVGPDERLERAIDLMEENAIQHLVVIARDGSLLGLLVQSEIGRRLTNREFGQLARKTSIRSSWGTGSTAAVVRRT